MWMMQVTLIEKKALTANVFELHYQLPEAKTMLPGQFMTFILASIGGRSYSILEMQEDRAILVIKKWEIAEGGRGGSIMLCDAEIGDTFKAVWPAGHFVLKENTDNKLFLGTGTGLVPLYNQILEGLKRETGEQYYLVFGVRTHGDILYQERFEALKKHFPNRFNYQLFVSREAGKWNIQQWYVTDVLSKELMQKFQEYYICGAPAMVESCQTKLWELGGDNEKIYFEKYS